MKNFLLAPFRKIRKYALKVRLTPGQNRKRVGQSLFFVTIIMFAIFLLRFVWIVSTDQVAGVKLSEKSQKNFQETQVIQAKRGTIYDRNGVAIAIDSSSYSVYVTKDKRYINQNNEKLYAEKDKDFEKIEKLFESKLGMDKKYVKEQLNQDLNVIYFGNKGRSIDYNTRDSIEKEAKKQGIKGISFEPHLSRSYPNGKFASHFIGVAGLQDSDDESKGLIGQNGLEASMNSILEGKNGSQILQKNKLGVPLPGTTDSIKKAQNGNDVYTTLDASLQTYLETLMDTAEKETEAQEITATLVKADTGEILATSQRPTFNPDTKTGYDSPNFTWSNLIYQANFEPGSTMKVFTLASAIDTDKFEPDDYYTSGELMVADTPIHDWDYSFNPAGQTMNFAQGFSFSSNIGMTLLEQKMTATVWRDYLTRFKFGKSTNMGVGSEASGIFPVDNIVTTAMSSFGQGIGVTGLQMLRGFLAISNGGTMLEPHFVSKIVTDDNKVKQVSPEIVGKPVDATSANQTLQYMINVGTDPTFGTAYDKNNSQPYFRVDSGQNVSVKTGTAQIASDKGEYMTGANDYIYSAVTITPSENPEFIMYVTVKIPKQYTLANISDITNPIVTRALEMKDSLSSMNVDSNLTTKKTKIKDYSGKSPDDTADELRRNILSPVIVGDGDKIIKQSVSEGTSVNPNRRILLLTNGKIEMPDIYGWTKFDTEKFAEWMGLEVEFTGTGNKVISQSIDVNAKISKNKKLIVNLGV